MGDQKSNEQNRDILFMGNNNNDKDENDKNEVIFMILIIYLQIRNHVKL